MLKAKASICSEKLMRTVQRRFSWFELKPRHLYEDPQLATPCDLLAYNLDNRNLRGRCNTVTLAATATSIPAAALGDGTRIASSASVGGDDVVVIVVVALHSLQPYAFCARTE